MMPKVIFISRDGAERAEFEVRPNRTILDIAHEKGIDIEGACGGSMACSTCHILVDERYINKLPPPSEEEDDMLDLTCGVTKNSRLGCQTVVTEELDGLIVQLPSEIINRQNS